MQYFIILTALYSFHIGYYAGTFFGFVAVLYYDTYGRTLP
jgi:hypothetical protein